MRSYYELDSTPEPSTIGETVAYLRHAMGYNQVQFAEGSRLSRSSLAKLEKAENENIGIEVLYRLYYIACRIEENSSNIYIKHLTQKLKEDVSAMIEAK